MEEIKRGMVVRSLAGHDKNIFCVVLGVEGTFALIADGKHRPLEKSKRKKIIHISPTNIFLQEDNLSSNRKIRAALRQWNDADRSFKEEVN